MEDNMLLLNQALQACELLKLSLDERSSKNEEATASNNVKVRDLIYTANEALREAKHTLEHNDACLDIKKDKMNHELERLRCIRLTYRGLTLPESMRSETVELMRALVEGQAGTSIELLFLALYTCPWHAISQREPGQKAKHNRLVAVYSLPSTTFWRVQPIDVSLIEMEGVLAIEVCNFLQHIARGHVTYVEFLHLTSNCCLIQSSRWQNLVSTAATVLLELPAFVAQCHGQAIGSVSKKARRGVKDLELDHGKASYSKLCESLRLLCHAEMLQTSTSGTKISLVMEEEQLALLRNSSLSETGKACLDHITKWSSDLANGQQCTVDCGFDKEKLLELILQWNQQLLNSADNRNCSAKVKTIHRAEQILGDWHCAIKLKDIARQPVIDLDTEQQLFAEQLLRPLGGFASRLCTNSAEHGRILLVARAGSFMYNLNTADSDVDYIVLYAINSEQEVRYAATASQKLQSHENRGPSKQVEFGAYEARIFAEMLLKGSVVMLELVFVIANEMEKKEGSVKHYWPDIVTPTFCELCQQLAKSLVNETSIRQFIGLVEHNLRTLRTGRWYNEPKKEAKMLYQVHHKLLSIQQMCHGQMPRVYLEHGSDERERILAIRHSAVAPSPWPVRRIAMIAEAEANVTAVRRLLGERSVRLNEMLDQRLVTKWLMRTRGLQIDY